MSICYEFALECKVKNDVSQKIVDTLKYMTRSQEYDFHTPRINHPLFQENFPWQKTRKMCDREVIVIDPEWRTIITNQLREGEQYLTGRFCCTFKNQKLSIRRLLRDDEFLNICGPLLSWLASISDTAGCVGYYRSDFDNYPTLIHFENGKADVYELTSMNFLQVEGRASNDMEESTLGLEVDSLTEAVKQEMLRQAGNAKMSLEAYLSSIVFRKSAMNAALELGYAK